MVGNNRWLTLFLSNHEEVCLNIIQEIFAIYENDIRITHRWVLNGSATGVIGSLFFCGRLDAINCIDLWRLDTWVLPYVKGLSYQSLYSNNWKRWQKYSWDFFYWAWVRSLATLVSNSLTNWLTPWLWIDLIDVTLACDDAKFKICWGCWGCWSWCWGSCWQQCVIDLGADVWS